MTEQSSEGDLGNGELSPQVSAASLAGSHQPNRSVVVFIHDFQTGQELVGMRQGDVWETGHCQRGAHRYTYQTAKKA